MPTKEIYNSAASYTYLTAAISSTSATTITVNASNYATGGNFRIKIDAEIMLVTGVSGTTLTVTRGYENTTAATHANNTDVVPILTDGALRSLCRQSIDTVNQTARREVNFKQLGGVYATMTDDPTNDKVDLVLSAGGLGVPFTQPVLANFTALVSKTGASLTQSGSGLLLKTPGVSTDGNATYGIAPGSTPWSLVANMKGAVLNKTNLAYGMYFANSSSNLMHRFGFQNSNMISDKYVSANGAFSSAYLTIPTMQEINWLRIQDDGTNRNCYFSADGTNWHLFHQITRTDYLTADRAGIFVSAYNVSTTNLIDAALMLMSFKLN